MLVYLFLWLLAFFIAPDMIYQGPENVQILSTMDCEKLLKAHEKAPDDEYLLLELFATWSPPCQHLAPEYAEVSLKYGTPGLQFAKADVGRNPPIAKKYGVNTSASSTQIPTVILFKNGKEVVRRPEVAENGTVIACKLGRALIEQDFDLHNLYATLKKTKRKGPPITIVESKKEK